MAMTALAVTAATIDGTSILAYAQSMDFEITNETEDASGIADRWSEDIVVGSGWRLEGEMHFTTSAAFVATAASGDVEVAVSFNSGGNTYAGNAIIQRAAHRAHKRAIQTQNVTLVGVGAPTVTAPS